MKLKAPSKFGINCYHFPRRRSTANNLTKRLRNRWIRRVKDFLDEDYINPPVNRYAGWND